jgi:hypothetical protein
MGRKLLMADFILEEQIEYVVNKNTKKYLKEVLSSYNNHNYRSAVVVLYTTVIYDLLQKVVILKEIYNDEGAGEIISEIKSQQNTNHKSPEWEAGLIENVYRKMKIISGVEKDELLYLKNQRNYAAHPIINFNDEDEELELKQITKETASDLIRKAFEIVFLRDAILATNIDEDIVLDSNEFYKRVKIDGLERFLNIKYFRRMTQERKDHLFKTLWKFVFILNDKDCKDNRESNYWTLLFLYNENKYHYQDLVKENEFYFFNKLQLETFSNWRSEHNNVGISPYVISIFKSESRIIFLIKLLENIPEMYNLLNDHAKNILQQSIKYMYIQDDVINMSLYEAKNVDSELFKEQIKLKSMVMYMCDNAPQHFEMIFKMINNYISTAPNWTDTNNYCVLDDSDLETIFHQSEYKGCTEEFLLFLVRYCTGAKQFYQALSLFKYLKKYNKYFKEYHYYFILMSMNNNSQYYQSKDKDTILNELEKMFRDSFNSELIKEKEDKYLYRNLYFFDNYISDYSVEKVLKLIEKRALYYDVLCLHNLICNLLDHTSDLEFLKEYEISFFPNILKVLDNKNDSNYNEYYAKNFKGYFKTQ